MSIEINNESDITVNEESLLRLAVHTLDYLAIHPQAELSILLVNEPTMERLHIRWMDEEGPTDVLSFPMDELEPGSAGQLSAVGILGDVVLCPQVAAAQARSAGHSAEQELHLLTVHGILHLLGYDHAEPEEKKEMFALQGQILRDFGAKAN